MMDDPTCGAASDSILCSSNGDYHFCTLFRKPLGNARTTPLEEVWHRSREMLELRGTTWKNFPQCTTCEAFQFCSMCFAKNYVHSGDHLQMDPHCCEVAFLNKRLVERVWREQNVDTGAIGPAFETEGGLQ
jgi:radical SAM protein with 4Fe4S-binding SPASM domain